ncbi:MAG TPA: potassium transporter Kup [Micropepsaceae bacterium]|nr:potassium transporter Kup [Micropepsaceae bacterium]
MPQNPIRRQATLTLAALGIVYGDIGTSPIYAFRSSIQAVQAMADQTRAVLGVVSLILWSLIIVVTVKYVIFILRADNNGEGGVLALSQLAHRSQRLSRRMKSGIVVAGVLGLALFYGDGLLTPAISVLSAVEGIAVDNRGLQPLVLPLTVVILIGLFLLQSRGTARVGGMFGPIMIIWFGVLGYVGFMSIAQTPSILFGINPWYGVSLVAANPKMGFFTLGVVFLAVTGAEALYADMGHLGRRAIRIAWLILVLPSLILNYLGQGAAVLRNPKIADSVFFSTFPAWAHFPIVLLATVATVIASQAVISGVFSITQQAVQLGQLPRMEIRHTSATEFGQIYVPRVNWLLLFGTVLVVLMFRSSDALAYAYGIAVSGQMVISTALVATIARRQWKWDWRISLPIFGLFVIIDLTFFSANALKFVEGGWFPLLVAACVSLLMNTWRTGRRVLMEKTYGSGISTELFLQRADRTPVRVAGTAVFITPRLDEVPGALLHNLKHNQVLHERVIFLRVDVQDVPFVPQQKRLTVHKLGKGFYTVEIHFGFFQTPTVPEALEAARAFGLAIDIDTTTFFIRRETLVPARVSAMARWQVMLFIRLYASALEAARFLGLPPGRVVELGSQTEI